VLAMVAQTTIVKHLKFIDIAPANSRYRIQLSKRYRAVASIGGTRLLREVLGGAVGRMKGIRMAPNRSGAIQLCVFL
jgi:hypothetical protein